MSQLSKKQYYNVIRAIYKNNWHNEIVRINTINDIKNVIIVINYF